MADVDPYETALSPEDELEFAKWKAQYAPKDSGVDYDLRGAFKAALRPGKNGHWPDTFKKPNHPTFSDESIYAKYRPDLAGHWEGEKYIPPTSAPGATRNLDAFLGSLGHDVAAIAPGMSRIQRIKKLLADEAPVGPLDIQGIKGAVSRKSLLQGILAGSDE